ncbi:hypothetical protein Tco_0989102 [Tanacetum coccineum]|uniref:Uncharacterized protein n=1 Tax=Tanacetum coccineum TaxID=301880 RepID=A0ABQ5ETF0_9ASTR
MVEITKVVIPVNVNDDDEEITDEVYELKRREKEKLVEETRNSPIPTPIRSPRIHTNLVSSDTEKLQDLTDTPHTTSSSSSPHKKLATKNRESTSSCVFQEKLTYSCSNATRASFIEFTEGPFKGYLFAHLRERFMLRKSFDTLVDNLHDVMVETLPTMVDKHIKEQVMKQVPEQVRNQLHECGNIQAQILTQIKNAIVNVILSQVDAFVRSYMSGHILHVHPAQSQTSISTMKFERNTILQTACRTHAVRPRDQDDPHDDAHPEGENSAKRQKTLEWRLDELAYGIPSDGPYQTNPPSIEDNISSIRIDREGQVRRICHEEEIDVLEYQILTYEIVSTLNPLEFNLAYYIAKRMEWVTKQSRLILPYGMLLTRLFKFIMNEYPELYNESYVLYDCVMTTLAAQLERKHRRDRGMSRGCHSTFSSTFDQPSSSHLNDDDDDGNDKGTSCASTPSLIRYVNSLTNKVS